MPAGVGYGGYSTYTDYPEIEADWSLGPVQMPSFSGFGGGIYGATAQAAAGLGVNAAWAYIRQIAGNAARLTRDQWNRLPDWVRNTIIAAGIIVPELGDIPIPGRGGTDMVPISAGSNFAGLPRNCRSDAGCPGCWIVEHKPGGSLQRSVVLSAR